MPGFMGSFILTVIMLIFDIALIFPPLTKLFRYILPSPGEGPSDETMKNNFLRIHGYGTGSKGTRIKTILYYPKDSAYIETGRMIVDQDYVCL